MKYAGHLSKLCKNLQNVALISSDTSVPMILRELFKQFGKTLTVTKFKNFDEIILALGIIHLVRSQNFPNI